MGVINKIEVKNVEYDVEDLKAQEKLSELENKLDEGIGGADAAPIASTLNFTTTEDSVVLEGNTLGGESIEVEIPIATTEKAGVMSAEDKAFLESEAKVVVCEESKQLPEEVAEINITNSKDEIVHTITEEEANFKNLKSNGRRVLTNFDEVEQSETEDSEECIKVVSTTNKKELLVKITKDRVAFNKLSYLDGTDIQRIWAGKVFAAYGDSLTQLNSNIASTVVADGDVGDGWMNVVKGFFGFSKAYNRGIGGSRLGDYYEAFYDIYPNGSYVSRDEGDNTSEKSVNVRAAMCSWDRITKQFTEAIKDTIDLIFVMGGTNDFGTYFKEVDLLEDGYPEWSAENVKDTAWMSAEENYEKGDFDITTYSGAVCSLILKLQRWMPQARIVLLTPPTYKTSTVVDGEIEWVTDQRRNNDYGIPQIAMTEVVKKLATYMGVPCIDTHGGCGINVFNGYLWLTDRTHFNKINYVDKSTGRVYKNGASNFGRAVVGGMLGIFPVSWNQYSDDGKDLNNN